MNKKLFVAALAGLFLASCANDDYIGAGPAAPEVSGNMIAFGGESQRVTRAAGGQDAADLLGGEFKILGTANVGGAIEPIFNNYYVVWDMVNRGATDADGVLLDSTNVYGWSYLTAAHPTQEIKYWNLTAKEYNFVAFSGVDQNISSTTTNTLQNINGSNVSDIFVSDRVHATYSGTFISADNEKLNCVRFGDKVPFLFKRLAARVRLGLYETVPGYSVQNVKFYYGAAAVSANTKLAVTTPGLRGEFAESGNYVVTYDAKHSANADLEVGGTMVDNFVFGDLAYNANGSIGTSSATVTWAGTGDGWVDILPNSSNVTNLVLRVDYDLVPNEGVGTIHVYNASAVVPAAWCKWKPNYAYTYVFKITDQTSGSILPPDVDPDKDTDGDGTPDIYDDDDDNDGILDVDDPDDDGDGIPDEDETPDPGFEVVPDPDTENPDPTRPAVSPIVFDATVSDILDYNQETITNVTTLGGNSITTYSETSNVTDAAEYAVGEIIQVSSPSRGQWKVGYSDAADVTEATVPNMTVSYEIVGGETAEGQTIHQASVHEAKFTAAQAGYAIVWLRYLPNTKWADPADDVPSNYVDVYKVIKIHE